MRALAVPRPCEVAIMARDEEARVSVPRRPQPGIKGAASGLADRAAMRTAIIVDVIERQEFDVPLAAAAAIHIAMIVVEKRPIAILAETSNSVLVVALPAP